MYGDKQPNLSQLIRECKGLIENTPGIEFQPYKETQIHGTIFGLECRSGTKYHNQNFNKHRQETREMDFDGLLNYMRNDAPFPMHVQIGGFAPGESPFESNPFEKEKVDEKDFWPYSRSFSIQGEIAVMMGWPVRPNHIKDQGKSLTKVLPEAKIYPNSLDTCRKAVQSYGVLHAYHRSLTAVDNDLFFRIGMIKGPASKDVLTQKIRNHLAANPIVIEIGLKDLFIAAYDSNQLPPETTQIWSLVDQKVDGEFVASLYE